MEKKMKATVMRRYEEMMGRGYTIKEALYLIYMCYGVSRATMYRWRQDRPLLLPPMCRYKSLIVTRTEVLSSENSESHEDIIRKYEINDKISPPDFIRVEMIPTGDMADPQDWEYHLDQDTLPKWYDARAAETACRQEIKKMLRRGMKIEGSLEDCPGLTSLPNGIKIEGSLEDCPGLTSLPEGIKIGGNLRDCPGLTSLPEDIETDLKEKLTHSQAIVVIMVALTEKLRSKQPEDILKFLICCDQIFEDLFKEKKPNGEIRN